MVRLHAYPQMRQGEVGRGKEQSDGSTPSERTTIKWTRSSGGIEHTAYIRKVRGSTPLESTM